MNEKNKTIDENEFPLIKKYAIPKEKNFEFFNYFSSEQLEDFEQSLNQYFNEESITYNEECYENLESKEDVSFNRDILRLACGLITYEDFIEGYIVKSPTHCNLSFLKVSEYFNENQIENLMDYGSDRDEGLFHLSSMYQEIMDKLDIKYSNISTKDISDGKYLTTITFENNTSIKVDTSAWNGIEIVTQNVESIYEKFQNIKEKNEKSELENTKEPDYDFN